MKRLFALLVSIVSAGLLAACGGDANGDLDDLPPISGGTGSLAVQVTDAPIDQVTSAVIQFSGLAIKRAGAPERVFTFDPPQRIDLLQLQGGQAAALLPLTVVDAGPYESMRLLVDADRNTASSHVVLPGGAIRPLVIPAGAESGLITRGFSVPAGGSASFTVDLDLRKSVIAPGSTAEPFLLEPHLRLVDNSSLGAISGSVAFNTLRNASCPFPLDPRLNTNLVYVFEGANVVPDDIDNRGVEPVNTARISSNVFGGAVYTVAFLPPGPYTVAFTCQGALEDPRRNDDLVFLGTRSVVVQALATTVVDF